MIAAKMTISNESRNKNRGEIRIRPHSADLHSPDSSTIQDHYSQILQTSKIIKPIKEDRRQKRDRSARFEAAYVDVTSGMGYVCGRQSAEPAGESCCWGQGGPRWP